MDTDGIKRWCVASLVRALKTAAQTALAVIPTSAVTVGEVDAAMVLGAAALGALLSALTSLAGVPEVQEGASPLSKRRR